MIPSLRKVISVDLRSTDTKGDIMDWIEDFEKEMKRMKDEMNNVFSKVINRSKLPSQIHKNRKNLVKFREPAVHVAETETSYLLSFELPGVSKEEIELSAHGNQVELKVCSKKKQDSKDKHIYTSQEFHKTVTLPPTADPYNGHAKYHNGMLRLEFPKKETTSKKLPIS